MRMSTSRAIEEVWATGAAVVAGVEPAASALAIEAVASVVANAAVAAVAGNNKTRDHCCEPHCRYGDDNEGCL